MIQFAKDHNLCCDSDFVSILSNLLFTRPYVCAAAFDHFVDVRDLAINTVYDKWQQYLSDDYSDVMNVNTSNNPLTRILVKCEVVSNGKVKKVEKEITASLSLLHAALVLLGNWNEEEETLDMPAKEKNEEPKCDAVRNLARFLITKPSLDDDDKSMISGAAGAMLKESNKRAVSVDQVRH